MIIKLLPEQIPTYWEHIKFALIKTMIIEPKSMERYLINILSLLLTSRYQCWLAVSEEKKIHWLLISRIYNGFGGEAYFFIETLYGYAPISVQTKEEIMKTMQKFAKEIGCTYILCVPMSPLAVKVCQQVNMDEKAKIYMIKVGGLNEDI